MAAEWAVGDEEMMMRAICCGGGGFSDGSAAEIASAIMGLHLIVEYDRPRNGVDALQFFNECWGQVLIAVPIVESESS